MLDERMKCLNGFGGIAKKVGGLKCIMCGLNRKKCVKSE